MSRLFYATLVLRNRKSSKSWWQQTTCFGESIEIIASAESSQYSSKLISINRITCYRECLFQRNSCLRPRSEYHNSSSSLQFLSRSDVVLEWERHLVWCLAEVGGLRSSSLARPRNRVAQNRKAMTFSALGVHVHFVAPFFPVRCLDHDSRPYVRSAKLLPRLFRNGQRTAWLPPPSHGDAFSLLATWHTVRLTLSSFLWCAWCCRLVISSRNSTLSQVNSQFSRPKIPLRGDHNVRP